MAINKQKKEEILKELIDKFGAAKSVSFGQYSGMTVGELTDMRNKMREEGVEFKVAKKTLIKLAAKEHGLELPDEILEGTVGAAFSNEDAVSGPRILKDTSKKVEVVKLLGGVMEGKVLTISQMTELATLPSKEALLAKFVGLMRAPLTQFYGAINAPTSSFARAMQAYGEGLDTPAPAEEAPVEAAEAPEEASTAPAEETPTEEPSAEAAPAEDAATE